jgi:NitT/TauT family transport system permease protein
MRRGHILIAALSVGAFWELLALIINQSILPPPSRVLIVFLQEMASDLGSHFLASLWRVIASTAIAIALAAPIGVILGQSKRLNQIFAPVLYILYPIPKVVFVPVVLLFLGVGNLSKIAIITLILVFQIIVLVRDQAAALPYELLQSVRSLGAGRRALFRFVYLPASVPGILTALRQSIGTAVAVLYITELVATRLGLGYYIYLQGSTLFDYSKMYAGVVAMSLLGLGLYFSVDLLERRLVPWRSIQ